MIVTYTTYGRGLIEHLSSLDVAFNPQFFLDRGTLPIGGAMVYYEQLKVHAGGENFFLDLRFSTDRDNKRVIDSLEVFDHGYQKVATAIEIGVPVSAGSLAYKDDNLYLTGAVDRVYDAGGNDFVDLGNGNDLFAYLSGRDRIEGGGGLDVVEIDAARGDVRMAHAGSTWTITGTDIDLTLSGVERVRFKDQIVAIDVDAGQTTGAMYRMYEAALDRVPDQAGLRYYVALADNGTDLRDIARGFINSPEFAAKFGAALSTAAFVDALYQNILGRHGDASGVAYWNSLLDSNHASRAEVLIGFSESPENVKLVAPAIEDGIWLS